MKEEVKKKKKKLETSIGVSRDDSISVSGAFSVHFITGLFLAIGFWVVRNKYSADLISDPSLTLLLLYLPKTIHWSFLMSVFTFVPATAVFGASSTDWHRVFASLKPTGNIEYMILIPAYGAIIGGWFGAWPMPLDWEMPWQEWPICVCYGAIGGYIVGQIVSLILMVFLGRQKDLKLE